MKRATSRSTPTGRLIPVLVLLSTACLDAPNPTGPQGELALDLPVAFALGDPLSWTAISQGTTTSQRSIWGSGLNDIYTVGFEGSVFHSSDGGQTWQAQSTDVTRALRDVWGSGPSDVFAVGDGDFASDADIIHSSDGGATWEAHDSGTPEDLLAVWGSGPADVWAVGSGGGFFHYDGGTTWDEVSPVGQQTTSPFNDVHGTGSSDIWAVGSSSQVFHHDGTGWYWQQGPRDLGAGLVHWQGVWAAGPADVFVVGTVGTIIHYDGTEWSEMDSGTDAGLQGVWGSAGNDVYATGAGGVLLHYDGLGWSTIATGLASGLGEIWGASANDVFALTSVSGTAHVLHGHRDVGPNQPPTVEITSPEDGAVVQEGEEVTFEAEANDTEDGPLGGESVQWSSDLDGALGPGATLVTADLSVGSHVITVEVEDSQGARASDQITVIVDAPGNQPPIVTITSFLDGDEWYGDYRPDLAGSAEDPEDGPLTGEALVWTSDIDGELGRGELVAWDDFTISPGDHVITLTATDSEGLTGSASVAVVVYGNPEVRILEPADGAVFSAGQTVRLVGEATVAHWGPLDGQSLTWESDLDGPLGTGASLERDDLSVGVHVLTLTASWVVDGTATISIEVLGGSPPEVEILSPPDGHIVYVDELYGALGAATDPEDGPLTGDALRWESDLDGVLGTGEHLTGLSLSVGEHTLTLRATDSDGLAAEASVTLIVSDDPTEVILALLDELERVIDELAASGEISSILASHWQINRLAAIRQTLSDALDKTTRWRCNMSLTQVREIHQTVERGMGLPVQSPVHVTAVAADELDPLFDRLEALLAQCANPNS